MGESSLEGKVALVTGGGGTIGRAAALALAARGVRVVVTGRRERPLGETVGEIAYGGGKARHVVGDVRDPVQLGAAISRAIDVFGGLDFVIAAARDRPETAGSAETHPSMARTTFEVALPLLRPGGRLVAVGDGPGEEASRAGFSRVIEAITEDARARSVTCYLVLPRGAASEDAVAARIVELCSATGTGISGQTVAVP